MLQKEFFDRTGIRLSEEEFNKVHAMYTAADFRIDKAAFCADWKKHRDSVLLDDFYSQATSLKNELQKKNAEIFDLAVYILEEAEAHSSTSLRNKAIKMLGIKTYLQIKIERGYNLWQLDKDALVDILSKTK